jgi:hypothetical protein
MALIAPAGTRTSGKALAGPSMEGKECRASSAPGLLRNRVPALPGWADVWRAGPTGLGLAVLSGSHADTNARTYPRTNGGHLQLLFAATAPDSAPVRHADPRNP